MTDAIYKIFPAALWARREQEQRVPWAPVDESDGFVHLSSRDQVLETARVHFAGQHDLLLVAVDPSGIPGGRLRWEASRGGKLFPHVYGDIPLSAVLRVDPLELVDGQFVFPYARAPEE